MDSLFFWIISAITAIIWLTIAHFMYKFAPYPLYRLFMPAGAGLSLSIMMFVVSMFISGFRGMGIGIISASLGLGSVLAIPMIGLLALIGEKLKKDND
ncbi:YesK family protein [Paenibacillus sp. SYP-B4298]|uniref:YesK family protein n=1 Tax=Paenibacillus sp. SYP-B4298 TaxID=2996034 RepID=UPI0022DD553C|nr:YesK family protein [Paenibacillus sp. SYP-B4298]